MIDLSVTDEQRIEFDRWAHSLGDPLAMASALSHPAYKMYRLITTGHRVFIESYSEDGTVTVSITGRFNLIPFERAVFGIDVADLQPCDPPGEDEPVGVTMSEDEQLALMNKMRKSNGVPPVETLDELRIKNRQ